MPSVSLTNYTTTSVNWAIIGLSNPFNKSEYLWAGISQYAVGAGQSSAPTEAIWIEAPATGGDNYTPASYWGGFVSGDDYTIYPFVQSANGLYYPAGDAAHIIIPYRLTAPTVYGDVYKTTDTIGMDIFSSGASMYYQDCYLGNTQIGARKSSSNGYFHWTGLNPNTTYIFYAYATGYGYLQSVTGTTTQTTNEQLILFTPSISGTTVYTASSIDISIYSNNATYYYMDCYLDGTKIGSTKGSSSGSFSWTGLNSNSQYTFKYYATASGYPDSGQGTAYGTTRPTGWTWNYSKTSGGGFNITPSEWLDFINKIDATRVAKWGVGNEYAFTRTSSYFTQTSPFYYWMFRQASQAIDDMNGQVPNDFTLVNSGDDIYAWYFDTLETALNAAIGAL